MPHKGKGGIVYPVENSLLARLLVEERLQEAERNLQLRRIAGQKPAFMLRVELWMGEHLVHWGNRLMEHCTNVQHQSSLRQTARFV